MPKSRKIVFFFPSFASSDATAPLGILAVATPLLRAGYQICLIDSTITPNYKKRVLEEVRDALCLGISLVTGPMIRETVEIARAIKEWNPDFPIILGGWHPSLLPTQTLQAPYIDYVVRGQGEESLLELVTHIAKGSAPDFVAGRIDDLDKAEIRQFRLIEITSGHAFACHHHLPDFAGRNGLELFVQNQHLGFLDGTTDTETFGHRFFQHDALNGRYHRVFRRPVGVDQNGIGIFSQKSFGMGRR